MPLILLTSDQDKSKIFKAKQYNPQFYLLKPCKKLFIEEKLLSLAKTHGIQPPKGSRVLSEHTGSDGVVLHSDPASQGEGQSNKQIVSDKVATNSEEVAKILKQSVFVLNGRKTPSDFRMFL